MLHHADNLDTDRDPDMIWASPAEYAEIRRKRRSRAGVPSRFLDSTLETWDTTLDGQEHARNVARYYVENFPDLRRRGSGMLFFGLAGTGKTRMSCALVNELTDRGVDAMYTKFPAILNRVRRTFSARSYAAEESVESREGIVADLISYDFLVLDEVARVSGAADETGLLYDIIDGRYEESAPTVICSNLNRAGLIELMTERLVDRMCDQRGAFVAFDWHSRRQ